MRLTSSLIGLLAGTAAAWDPNHHDPNVVQEDLSFGAHGSVWTEDHRHVTGFNLGGEHGHEPELLSDRIIMTPPWPGNKAASLWADHPEPNEEWVVELNFRATGADHGSGGMTIWYVKDKEQVQAHSVYNVDRFDGLALVIDEKGHKGGSIRGFMNDGRKSYKSQRDIDSLAFGRCDFAYRNTGTFLTVEVFSDSHSFEVWVEGKECMKTNKVCLSPTSY
jgi:mannose-binding lectin 1